MLDGIRLRSEPLNANGTEGVISYLTIQCRCPLRCDILLDKVLCLKSPCFHRQVTEADMLPHGQGQEAEAGPLSPLGDSRCVIKVSLANYDRVLSNNIPTGGKLAHLSL
jgi:hypothetical protein